MKTRRDAPQPIPYQGSKRLIAPMIVKHFSENVSRIVEPFAGSAALSMAAAARGQCENFWLNDAHLPLIRLWRDILLHPNDLADRYTNLWNDQLGREREFFNEVRDRFNAAHAPADFLYLLARCVKAAVRYNAAGQFNNTPDNRRRGTRPPEMRRRILQASSLLGEGTRLTAWDYGEVLDQCTDTDVVYMDPPYQGVCGSRDQRYLPNFDRAAFCDQLAALNVRHIMFAVSYDGRTGAKTFGRPLPKILGLRRIEIRAGRSAQATLLGRDDVTYESLYLSPALVAAVAEFAKIQSAGGESTESELLRVRLRR